VQPNGQILVGGLFSQVNGTPSNHLARLNADGTVDTAFSAALGTGFNGGSVRAIVVQPNGDIVLGGLFTDLNGIPSSHLARISSAGATDGSFSSNLGTGFDNVVDAIAQDASGKLVVGGGFTSFNGAARAGVARLTANGTLDTTFTASPSSPADVDSIVVQNSGQIVVGGLFDSFGSVSSKNLARLNANGTVDAAFSTAIGSGFADPANTTSFVRSVTGETDGTLLVSGDFTQVNGVASGPIAHLSADGQILSGFSSTGFAQTTPYGVLTMRSISPAMMASTVVGVPSSPRPSPCRRPCERASPQSRPADRSRS
jgi:uncharacterized delta-60 repeat protein